MMLYEFSIAPGPRRVRIFVAEKGIEIPPSRSIPASGSNSLKNTAP